MGAAFGLAPTSTKGNLKLNNPPQIQPDLVTGNFSQIHLLVNLFNKRYQASPRPIPVMHKDSYNNINSKGLFNLNML